MPHLQSARVVRSLIVGTAGHIDHGKSALVRALTGTDPDRLKEERERGITTDLGFAHATLPGGAVASFIDVPGHERFVRHMLAGAHGIDAVVLVVAADESVMPQTREHFHICRLLGVSQGLIALTKCDLVDGETLDIARSEVAELVTGSFLAGAPVIPFSSRTDHGVDDLKRALSQLVAGRSDRDPDALLRLPIDRAFTMRGFGTVVTGTLVSGRIVPGQEVEVLPSGPRARVRGVQIHGRTVEEALAGSRTAVNLAGVDLAQVARGEVLTLPGTLAATITMDVEVSLLPGVRPLKRRSRVRVHAASADALGRIHPFGGDAIAPGGTALARIRLERALLVCRGDRLVLRSDSPADTLGGARVVDSLAPRRRGRRAEMGKWLEDLGRADATEAAALFVDSAGPAGIPLTLLGARVGLSVGALKAMLERRPDVRLWGREDDHAVSATAWGSVQERIVAELQAFHVREPHETAMSLKALRQRAAPKVPDALVSAILAALVSEGQARIEGEGAASPDHRPRLSPQEDALRVVLEDAAVKAGLAGLDTAAIERLSADVSLRDRVVRFLSVGGSLRRVGGSFLVHRTHLRAFEDEVRRRWAAGARVDVADIKALTGLTRKHVIPLLEYLDSQRVTRRADRQRVVL